MIDFVLQVGSIEGRVGVHHLDEQQQSKNFTFKCHREGNDIYSVNSLNFHPVRYLFTATYGKQNQYLYQSPGFLAWLCFSCTCLYLYVIAYSYLSFMFLSFAHFSQAKGLQGKKRPTHDVQVKPCVHLTHSETPCQCGIYWAHLVWFM